MGRTFDETETTVHEHNMDLPSPRPDEKDSEESEKSVDQVVQMEIDGELVEDDMDDNCPLEDEEDDVDEANTSETEEDRHVVDQQVNNNEHPIPENNGEQLRED